MVHGYALSYFCAYSVFRRSVGNIPEEANPLLYRFYYSGRVTRYQLLMELIDNSYNDNFLISSYFSHIMPTSLSRTSATNNSV